jgi:TPR repeat protein
MGMSKEYAARLLDERMADAAGGDIDALFDLGVVYASGSEVEMDFVQAHKWFNLAAARGDVRAQACRAELSVEMTSRQIAEAQRQARAWVQALSSMSSLQAA